MLVVKVSYDNHYRSNESYVNNGFAVFFDKEEINSIIKYGLEEMYKTVDGGFKVDYYDISFLEHADDYELANFITNKDLEKDIRNYIKEIQYEEMSNDEVLTFVLDLLFNNPTILLDPSNSSKEGEKYLIKEKQLPNHCDAFKSKVLNYMEKRSIKRSEIRNLIPIWKRISYRHDIHLTALLDYLLERFSNW